MYATCIHCHAALGTNESIEHFPVGQRLAFDEAKGRLWVVCAKCRRWNLTPLEERWEAIEECERLFRGTTLRASTDNIGLARLSSGMELIRIGNPLRPEIAGWRYAGNFRRRWIQYGAPIALFSGGASILSMSGGVLGYTATIGGVLTVAAAMHLYTRRVNRPSVTLPGGRVMRLSPTEANLVWLVPDGRGWGIAGLTWEPNERLTGPVGVHNLRSVITARNFQGATAPTVNDALGLLGTAPDASRFISRLARATDRTRVFDYPPDIAIALEMALHDDVERRALEGELGELRREWEMAEEIAKLSDDMFVPASVRDRFRKLRGGE